LIAFNIFVYNFSLSIHTKTNQLICENGAQTFSSRKHFFYVQITKNNNHL